MEESISYDIDQILEIAARENLWKGLDILWNALEPHTDEGRANSEMLPEELTAFALINFEMYMGNGFGRRMDFNYPNGIEEFFNARQAAEEMALVQTLALFTEVNDVLIKMGITRALCEELDIFCFFGLEDIVDASGLRKDFFPDSGSKCSLYDVFKKLSAPFHFDSRWAELGQSEMQPALIKFLHQNRDKLCCRKQKS